MKKYFKSISIVALAAVIGFTIPHATQAQDTTEEVKNRARIEMFQARQAQAVAKTKMAKAKTAAKKAAASR